MHENDFIIIRTFDTITEAYLIKNFLENNDVACVLQDEHTVGSYPMLSIGLGGIKLKIKKIDLEKAILLLDQFEKA